MSTRIPGINVFPLLPSFFLASVLISAESAQNLETSRVKLCCVKMFEIKYKLDCVKYLDQCVTENCGGKKISQLTKCDFIIFV